jgi:hypothetical protein
MKNFLIEPVYSVSGVKRCRKYWDLEVTLHVGESSIAYESISFSISFFEASLNSSGV